MEFEKIDRKTLLGNIRKERQLFEESLSRIPQDQFQEPIFDGGWSIKDVLAHIVAWEQRMITWIGQAADGIAPDIPNTDEAVDALNSQSFLQERERPLQDVLETFERSYLQAFAVAENTPEEVLFTENLLQGRSRPLWINIAANTCWHYKEHREALELYIAAHTDREK